MEQTMNIDVEQTMETIMDLCNELVGDVDSLIIPHPLKAAEFMELLGLLEGEIKEGLVNHMTDENKRYMPFIASGVAPMCLILQGSELEMVG